MGNFAGAQRFGHPSLSAWHQLARQAGRLAVRQGPGLLRQVRASAAGRSGDAAAGRSLDAAAGRGPARARPAPASAAAPTGRHLVYAPEPDGRADPGEIVWTWVVYEDDPAQGKDRPVLVVGRHDAQLLGLMLSSRSTRGADPAWLALGTGSWDAAHRPSWVRLDRVLAVPEDGIRREGAVLDRSRFDAVAAALRAGYGWQ